MDPLIMLVIAAAYLVGSIIKGISGFGSILIAVPIMSMVVDPPTAIALTSVPVIVSNFWQLFESGEARWAGKRFFPLLGTLIPGAFIGSQFLVQVDPAISAAVIGVMVIAFCISRLFPLTLNIPAKWDLSAAIIIGAVAGVFGGATILTGTILIVYLASLHLEKNQFVGAIALMYICSSLPIYLTLFVVGRYSAGELVFSAFLLIPAIAGLSLGRRIRDRVSQLTFERVVTALLFGIGILLVARSV